VQSRAFPPRDELDATLVSLLESPKKAVDYLETADLKAGYILSTYLSGYATVRKFYDLRDQGLATKTSDETPSEIQNRKMSGATALMAAITSAADSIRGGLLDPRVTVVIPVDNLLVLFGEALVYLNRKNLNSYEIIN
jgi:hypothetical protein